MNGVRAAAPPQESQVRGINKRKRDRGWNFGARRELDGNASWKSVHAEAGVYARAAWLVLANEPDQTRRRETRAIGKQRDDLLRGSGVPAAANASLSAALCRSLPLNAGAREETMTMT